MLTLQKLYNVNGQKVKLVEIRFTKLAFTDKGFIEYIFKNKKGKRFPIRNREDIQNIDKTVKIKLDGDNK